MSSNHVCPTCGKKRTSIFYEVNDVPVNSCVLLSTQQQALNFPRGNILLGFCRACGFISNLAFDPSKVDYSSVYEDQQCFSSTFNTFAENLANRLIQKHNLHNKRILEIGCGKGDFLALLCELGDNYGLGIDPAYIKGRIHSKSSKNLIFIRDYYSERYTNYQGNFVCCRHTLEHIPHTAKFLNTIRRSIGNHLDTLIFFEVPDSTRVLCELAFWDIYYEHCSYFTLGSIARLFRICKFEVTDLAKDFDNQYLLIEAKPVSKPSDKVHQLEESVEDTAKNVKYFSTHSRNKLGNWKNWLHQIQSEKGRAVVWGSGSKCVAFLTTLGVKEEIEYVIDINPYRHGKFIPGAGKKIMPPEFLKEYKPDVTLIMNPIYRHEIEETLKIMEVKTEVITV